MTDPNEPDKKNEGTESTEDEAIIELTEEVTEVPGSDEATIDLVEAVEGSPEEEMPVEIKEETIGETKGDEEIIDLLEVAEDQEPLGDEVITEIKEETTEETQDIGEPVADDADVSKEFDDIDDFDGDLIKETIDFTDELETTPTMDEATKDDFADSIGIEIDAKEDISGDISESDRITDEQLEAALERVIKKVFYEKIDRLLTEAIEKTVTKEIERLKKSLLKDSPDGEK